MPEGPSLVILHEQIARFAGRRILRASGNSKLDLSRLAGRTVTFRTWGKHLLIQVPGCTLRVHFLMFGSYTIDERKDREPRLRLEFAKGEVNFYSCAIKEIEGDLDAVYDWSADVLSDAWDAAAARRKLRGMPGTLACDALLDQQVFAGVGNIIKNEVLFRVRVHPLSKVGALPAARMAALVEQAREYSFDFLRWKREYVLRKHWLVHTKRTCPKCSGALTKAHLGVTQRRSFYCERCQKLYAVTKKKKKRAR
jgi:endonuclease-8